MFRLTSASTLAAEVKSFGRNVVCLWPWCSRDRRWDISEAWKDAKSYSPILVVPSWQTEDAQVHVQTVYVRNESLLSFASSDLPFLQSFYLCVSHRYWYDECTAAKST